jgi:two-component system, LytTR family, sensor kinase
MPTTDSRAATFRRLAFLLACVWLGTVLFVCLRQVSGLLTERDFSPNLLSPIGFVTKYFWLPWFVIAPLVAALAIRLPIRPDRWLWPLCANVLAFLIISVVHSIGVAYFYHYFGDVRGAMATYAPWQHSGHFLFGDNMFLFDIITYAVLCASLNMSNFHQIVQRQELDAMRLRETLTELRLQTLRMQINPHFLFNSLNAVAVLVQMNESQRAVETINRIASFFRRTLDGTCDQWVPLERELAMATEYLAIAKVRYGDRLNVIEECEHEMKSVPVPAMLLQPLIENAVVHGIAERPGRCALAVRCRGSHEQLVIEISDDGAGSALRDDPRFREGTGLTNVRLRLQQLYGDNHAFAIESRPGHGTRVTIVVPIAARNALQALAV